jgi:hypothetical protein
LPQDLQHYLNENEVLDPLVAQRQVLVQVLERF